MAERVLVTGSASGLGRAIATRFGKAGHRVLVSDVDGERARATAEELGVRAIRLDITDDGDWAAAREWCEREWGGLDVLVNNAGVAAGGRFERIELSDWDWIWEINVKGVVRGCRTFVPDFKARHGAVISLSETLRLELEPYGVRTTVVCPGFVRTNLGDRLRSPDPAIATLMDKLDGRRSALLKRFGLTDGQVRKYWARLRKAVEKERETAE